MTTDTAPAPPCLLLVDDTADQHLLVEAWLEGTDWRLDQAWDGGEAVERCQRQAYDLVLMDVHMPTMDGYEATRRIRADEQARGAPPVPVVVLSGDDDEDLARQAGCNGRLVKPLRRAALLDLLATMRLPPRPYVTVAAWLAPLMPTYLAHRHKDLAALQTAVAESDLAAAGRIGHALKGSGGSYGLQWLTDLGAELETAAEAGDLARVGRAVTALREWLEQVEVRLA